MLLHCIILLHFNLLEDTLKILWENNYLLVMENSSIKRRPKDIVFLFLRFLYLVVIYCCLFMPPGPTSFVFFPLDYRFFFSHLVVYFIFAIIFLFISEKKFVRIKYAFDLLFVVLLSIMTIIVFCSGLNSSDGGGILVIFIIFQYFPIYIPFIIWLVRDIKLLKKNSNR